MATLTTIHVLLSLVGIAAGVVVTAGLLSARRFDRWTSVFLWSTVATSVTGFLFPFQQLLPSHIVGALSLVVLAVALFARYARLMFGSWRATYVVTAIVSFYLNVFVLVVQAFLKVPALNALAPTQSEPPFAVAQLIVLAIFVGLGIRAVARFRPVSAAAQSFTAV